MPAVRALAKRRGWTMPTGRINHAAVARALNLSRAQVNRTLNGRQEPSIEFRTNLLAEAQKVRPDAIPGDYFQVQPKGSDDE
jgi:transcriptional regulator with XRE-family HTH domain